MKSILSKIGLTAITATAVLVQQGVLTGKVGTVSALILGAIQAFLPRVQQSHSDVVAADIAIANNK